MAKLIAEDGHLLTNLFAKHELVIFVLLTII